LAPTFRSKKNLKKKTTTLFFVVSNPEFLKEGAAIKDFQNPDRIVLGGEDQEALSLMTTLYKPFERVNKPILVTSYENAELIKYASNAMLAMRISFMNELAGLCEIAGADIKEIIKGIGLDERIGPRFLQAGIGYGGSCFPKDIKALAYAMEQRGLKANLLRAVDYVNEVQKRSLVPKLKSHLGPLEGKRIGIWGLSFKPRTDDVRNAPAFDVIDQLLVEGALVQVYDPVAMENAKKVLGNKVFYADSMYAAAEGASALVIATEWDDFRLPDFSQLKQLMRVPFIVDGRNLYQPAMMQSLGFAYLSVGRPFVGAAALKHGH
ncbi:MAG: UDP-glucose/GDP-mannose dehydrogenase family protein, partial [Candidatus Woesearchaeota archaeon]